MTREITIAAAQLGPIQKSDTREAVIERLLALLHRAADRGCDLVVFPELALTTFFPRWYMEDETELNEFYESEMPSPVTQPLFDAAKERNIGFCLGYAELTADKHRYNTQIMVERDGSVVGKYRKVHLPGHAEHEPWREFQHLEKRYFEIGPDGFQTWNAFGGVVGMAICNDRRWSETYRILGLGGAELITIGYNTPVHNPPAPEHDVLSNFHNQLVMQAGAYQNGTWVVGVAKAGVEEGVAMIGNSCIIAPSGEVVASCTTWGDELAIAVADLDLCNSYKNSVFNFEVHRQPQMYGDIINKKGATPPA